MKAFVLVAAAVLVALAPISVSAKSAKAPRHSAPRPEIMRWHPNALQQSGGHASLGKAWTDSFNIYGGVRRDGSHDRRPEGQFQGSYGQPLQQNWTSHDLTQKPTFWHASTFNAANLDPAPGNNAMWAGVPGSASGFTTAPGYGNNWDDRLEWLGQTNPATFTNVRLLFSFNHDTEPGYDFFKVEYDSAGGWLEWLSVDGTNKDTSGTFITPVSFDKTELFTPFMYTGPSNADVHLRMRVVSDGAWSDEDGLFPTKGAAQVDNVQVRFNGTLVTQHGDGTATFEDLGGGNYDVEGWTPFSADYVGDFAKLMPILLDIDPCRTNKTPQIGFIDDGSPPNNAPLQTTGGTTSNNWAYGLPGGWVVNYNGGLTAGASNLTNEWWSPEVDWDDPGSTEDDGLVGGAFFRYDTWRHLPLINGIFYVWHVRSHDGNDWTAWQDRNFVYYGDSGGAYLSSQVDVSDLMADAPTKIQMALGVNDLASLFAFAGTDATPSPVFDNVSFWRYDLAGPAFSTRNIDLFNDGFPTNGASDPVGSPASMAVRLDMARDISTGSMNAPGDSVICDVTAAVPGTVLGALPTMEWILDANPVFDGVRSLPGGATNIGTNADGWNQWIGTVTGDSARTSSGAVIADRFFFDAPNDGNAAQPYQSNEPAMFFSGDRFRYFFRAEDDLANTTTLPPDTTGFLSGPLYSRVFTVRALPSYRDDGGGGITQPDVIVVNDFGHRGGEATILSAFAQNGLFESKDFDIYTVMGPSSLVSNGIGSSGAHGANAAQLGGYSFLLYESGDLSSGVLSDGSNANGNDKGDDVGVLTAWHDLPGDRFAAHFGDHFASFLSGGGSSAQTYLSVILGVQVTGTNVRAEIGNQATPLVVPTGLAPGFSTSFIANGGCVMLNQFDSIDPTGAAIQSHDFQIPGGGGYDAAAGVWHGRAQVINTVAYSRIDMTFPYGFLYILDPIQKVGVRSARSFVMDELLNASNVGSNPGAATDTPATPLVASLRQNHPNPFNPSTEISFIAPQRGRMTLRIYNVRGELVRTLHDGMIEAGTHSREWNGRDDGGSMAASGIYLYKLDGFGQTLTKKMALLK
jgi:hypothetical protein